MLTPVIYVVVMALVAGLLYLIACVVFGRSEDLPPLPVDTTATRLPVDGITAADVRALRFQQVLRGYKAGEVDWALERLGREIELLRGELESARRAADPSETDEESS